MAPERWPLLLAAVYLAVSIRDFRLFADSTEAFHSVETVAVVVPVAVDTPLTPVAVDIPLTPVVAVLAETDRLEAAALKDAVVDVAPSKDEM